MDEFDVTRSHKRSARGEVVDVYPYVGRGEGEIPEMDRGGSTPPPAKSRDNNNWQMWTAFGVMGLSLVVAITAIAVPAATTARNNTRAGIMGAEQVGHHQRMVDGRDGGYKKGYKGERDGRDYGRKGRGYDRGREGRAYYMQDGGVGVKNYDGYKPYQHRASYADMARNLILPGLGLPGMLIRDFVGITATRIGERREMKAYDNYQRDYGFDGKVGYQKDMAFGHRGHGTVPGRHDLNRDGRVDARDMVTPFDNLWAGSLAGMPGAYNFSYYTLTPKQESAPRAFAVGAPVTTPEKNETRPAIFVAPQEQKVDTGERSDRGTGVTPV